MRWRHILFVFLCVSIVSAQKFEGRIVTKNITVDLNVDKQFATADEAGREKLAREIMKLDNSALKQRFAGTVAPYPDQEDAFTEMEMEIWVKGTKIAMEMGEGEDQGTYIIDWKSRDVFMIVHSQKMVMKMNLDKMAESMPDMEEMKQPAEPEEPDQFKISPTGQKKKINGYASELYEGTGSRGEPIAAWLSKDLAVDVRDAFLELEEAMDKIDPESNDDEEFKFYMSNKLIPVIEKSIQDGQLDIQELVKVDKTAVPADKFTVPSGYREMDMVKMMQGMGF